MSLTAQHITFQRQNKVILQDISLNIAPGEVVALLGTNGAGKSTLLEILSGTLAPKAGHITLNGHDRHHWSLSEQAQQIAVLLQSYTLYFPLTVEEVVLLGRIPHATSESENHAIAQQALAYVDMQWATGEWYSRLSGGECQRVQLARVMAQILDTPNISRYLLLDEPTSALDIAHQHQMLQRLRRLAVEDSIGVMIILHDLNLAMQYADRVIILQKGQIVGEGAPQEVLTADFIESVFSLRTHIVPHPDEAAKNVVIPYIPFALHSANIK